MRIYQFFILCFCVISFFGSSNSLYAADDIIVTVSEDIPGAGCSCVDTINNCTKVETRKYNCTAKPGLEGFLAIFGTLVRYIINIVLLLGVLAVVGLGLAWSFAGGDDVKMKSTLKNWAINILVGLTILFLFSYILRLIAPWVYE